MTLPKWCPGSQSIRNPQPEYISCYHCGSEVEIWTDEREAKCPKCKAVVSRDRPPSCIDWCTYAEKCFGAELVARLRKKD